MNDLRNDPDADPRPTMQETFANIREKFGAYFDAIPDVDAFVREQRGGATPTAPAYTLMPWPQSVNQRLARYEAELSRLRDAHERQAQADTERLEAIESVLHSQANMLQVLWLEHEARGNA
jgi:hypothetical protein